MKQEDILKFALDQGYEGITFLKKWHGYDCYEPDFGGEVVCIGLPLVIMVKGNIIRMSTTEEALKI